MLTLVAMLVLVLLKGAAAMMRFFHAFEALSALVVLLLVGLVLLLLQVDKTAREWDRTAGYQHESGIRSGLTACMLLACLLARTSSTP